MANNRKLGRPTDHRKAMLRALVTYLLENGKVETTLARAKEVGPMTEKMITLGKKNSGFPSSGYGLRHQGSSCC